MTYHHLTTRTNSHNRGVGTKDYQTVKLLKRCPKTIYCSLDGGKIINQYSWFRYVQ